MNFSDRITFIHQEESYYDPEIGGYVDSDRIKTVKPCKISTMGFGKTTEVFGDVSANVLVARLQNPYNKVFSVVEVDSKEYKVLRESNYKKGVLFLRGDDYESKIQL